VLGRAYKEQDCSIARSLEVVGERWTLLVLRDLSFGLSRFDELQKSLGIAPNILTARLRRLEEEGLVERMQYQPSPRRFAYRLTDKGLGLRPVLFYLAKWGDRHYASDLGPPRLSVHRDCGGEVDEQLVCARCGDRVSFDRIETLPGHGREVTGSAMGAGTRPSHR
jgi:DNA-binding HxlR family transcriptional regulator